MHRQGTDSPRHRNHCISVFKNMQPFKYSSLTTIERPLPSFFIYLFFVDVIYSGEPTGRSASPSETGPKSGRHAATVGHSAAVDGGVCCSHSDYPCRFKERSAWNQRVVPHRVFAPACLLQKAGVIVNRFHFTTLCMLGQMSFSQLQTVIYSIYQQYVSLSF